MRIYTRDEIGLRDPVKVSKTFDFSKGGVALHYGGDGPTKPPTELEAVFKQWRDWQAFHIDGRGWNDIAYSYGVSDAGHILTGRGIDRRNGANGTNTANETFASIVWIGGGNAKPSDAAIDAIVWLVSYCRDHGVGTQVRPHHYFFPSECPGPILTSVANDLNNKPINLDPVEDDEMADIQVRVPSAYEKTYGKTTDVATALRVIWTLEIANRETIRAVGKQSGLTDADLDAIEQRVRSVVEDSAEPVE